MKTNIVAAIFASWGKGTKCKISLVIIDSIGQLALRTLG